MKNTKTVCNHEWKEYIDEYVHGVSLFDDSGLIPIMAEFCKLCQVRRYPKPEDDGEMKGLKGWLK